MKRNFIIFPVLLLIANLGFAQYQNYGTYFISKMGISVGGVLSTTSIDYKQLGRFSDIETSIKPGFSILLTTEEDMNDVLKYRADVGYLQSGFKYKYPMLNTTGKFTSHDVYANVEIGRAHV